MIRYAITHRASIVGDGAQWNAELVRRAERWAADGIDFVQLREKDLEAGALAELARKLVAAVGAHTKLLVNGRADVAVAAGAAGVHLTAHPEELTPSQVRWIFKLAGAETPIISVSCHTVAELERARDSGADAILFGPMFEKRVDGDVVVEGLGLEALRRACETAGVVKVLALGGVTRENATACVDAGAAGVAGIRLFG
jgi:thiamine-phosphate pyrophosphorylase